MSLCIAIVWGFVLLHTVPLRDYSTISLISSAAGDHLGCFVFGAIRNKGAMTILVARALTCPEYTPRDAGHGHLHAQLY